MLVLHLADTFILATMSQAGNTPLDKPSDPFDGRWELIGNAG